MPKQNFEYLCIRWRDLNDKSGKLAGYSIHSSTKHAQEFLAAHAGSKTMCPAIRGELGVGARKILVDANGPIHTQTAIHGTSFIPVVLGQKKPPKNLKQLHEIFTASVSESKLPMVVIEPKAQEHETASSKTQRGKMLHQIS